MSSRKSYVPLDGRYAERVTITCRVRYVGEVPTQPHQGEGLTKNISVSGCYIISDRPVTRGTLLTLTIALPDGLPQLSLKSAHVVWVSGCQFEPRPSEAVAIFHLEKHLPSNRKRSTNSIPADVIRLVSPPVYSATILFMTERRTLINL